jgi:agmatine deiminase
MPHRVPPEEAPHEATFMQWPVTREVYGNHRFREDVQDTILRLANAIAAIRAGDPAGRCAAPRRPCRGVSAVWSCGTSQPTTYGRGMRGRFSRGSGGGQAISHIRFNGWGNRQGHRNDGRIAERVAERLGLP